MITDLYIGSGPNLIYPNLTEIIRGRSGLNLTMEFESSSGITEDSQINTVLELRGKIYG